jgi:hypothetical protein
MNSESYDRIIALLEAIKADFPRRKRDAEALMSQLGFKEPLELEIAKPHKVSRLPTFDLKTTRDLTPMLKARFDHAGTFTRGRDVWLAAAEMASSMKQQSTYEYHVALRENWDDSAPMLFPDECLTLFGKTEGAPDNLIYLVWPEAADEPEIWVYAGFQTGKFTDLEQYLKWCLERE